MKMDHQKKLNVFNFGWFKFIKILSVRSTLENTLSAAFCVIQEVFKHLLTGIDNKNCGFPHKPLILSSHHVKNITVEHRSFEPVKRLHF